MPLYNVQRIGAKYEIEQLRLRCSLFADHLTFTSQAGRFSRTRSLELHSKTRDRQHGKHCVFVEQQGSIDRIHVSRIPNILATQNVQHLCIESEFPSIEMERL